MNKNINRDKLSDELARIRSGKTNSDTLVYYVLQSNSDVVIVKEGHKGYNKTDWNWGNVPYNEACKLAEEKNTAMGISPETAEAIVIFSMFG